MTLKKISAITVAMVMSLSLSATAFATSDDESATENVTNEEVTGEEYLNEETTVEEQLSDETTTEEILYEETSSEETATEEAVPEELTLEESVSDEETSEELYDEQTTVEEPSSQELNEADAIILIAELLSQINFGEVADTLNNINEALGLPRVESFTDIPEYADAIYQKLEEMGLGYGEIINSLATSDLLDWLNSLIFSGSYSDEPDTTLADVEDYSDEDNIGESTPDTGIALGGTIAALVSLSGSSALALVLRKRKSSDK